MNLLARYNMLRTAVIAMIGVTDDVGTLKQIASILRVPATVDSDAAASLLVLQTLITTHGTTEQEVPDAWAKRMKSYLYNAANIVASDEDARGLVQYIVFGNEPTKPDTTDKRTMP